MPHSSGAPSVLLLDQDSGRRRGLAERLQSFGYRVTECGSVRDAVRQVLADPPQVLVLEHRLGDGTALDVVEQTRSARRPFVVVHGDWPSDVLPPRPEGVDVCLPHPVLDRDITCLLAAYVPLERCFPLPGIRRGDHLLALYDDRTRLNDLLSMYVGCGLAEGERCVVACDDAVAADELRAHLERSGLDVERSERSRSLILVTHDESYLLSGRFDPRLMLDFVRDLVEGALVDGFNGLRAAGEGSWVPTTPEDHEAWFYWETEIEKLFHGSPMTGLCFYDRRRFSPSSLLEAVRTHPVLLDGRAVCENAFFGTPSWGGDSEQELRRRMSEIRRARRLDG